jgi:putative tryptophan/tyrosine transport system substrate-binding protein
MRTAMTRSSGRPPTGPRHSMRGARRWQRHATVLLTVAILSLTAGCTLSAPGVRPAGRVHRIGYLTSAAANAPAAVDGFQQFKRRLEELGYQDGQNLTIEYRYTDDKEERFPDLAAELVGLPVDISVVGDSRAIPIAKAATSTIPIVMAISGDVVGQRLVASLARPGGNLTGLTNLSRPLNVKRLELLREVKPQTSRVAVLWNRTLAGLRLAWGDIEAAAPALGVDLVSLDVQGPEDLDKAFEVATRQPVDALCVLPDPLTNLHAQEIVDFAARQQLPAIYGTQLFLDTGGLMYYGPSRAAMSRRAADYVDKILNGADPATLPIEQPSVFEFAINLKAAQGLGLTMPKAVFDQATEVRG